MNRRQHGPIFQIAYVVRDLDEAIAFWTGTLGVGPFFVVRHAQFKTHAYRGSETAADVSLAFAYSGEVNIELVQQHNDAPSVYRDFQSAHGFGLQHIGVLTDDIEAETHRLADQGVAMVQRGVNAAGFETRFFDTAVHPGAVLELIQASPQLLGAFQAMKDAAASWDGTKPIA